MSNFEEIKATEIRKGDIIDLVHEVVYSDHQLAIRFVTDLGN